MITNLRFQIDNEIAVMPNGTIKFHFGLPALRPCHYVAYDVPFRAIRAGLRYIPAISMAVCIIANLVGMFNENKTFFIKKLETKALRCKGTERKSVSGVRDQGSGIREKRRLGYCPPDQVGAGFAGMTDVVFI